MIKGRDAIRSFWADLVTSANGKSASLGTVEIVQSGESAVEIGKATLKVAPPGQADIVIESKYVVCWRQEDGRWKWRVDIWNSNAQG